MTSRKARVLASVVGKGGVLKTSSAVSLSGVILGDKTDGIENKKVLIIDLDTQGNCSNAFGQNPDNFEKTIYDVLIGNAKAEEAIVNVFEDTDGRIDLLPANDDLSMIDMTVLTNLAEYGAPLELLKKTCGHLVDQYDYIIFDTPPHTGMLVLNVLSFNVGVEVEILVPFQPENFGFRALNKIFDQVKMVKETGNPHLKIGIVFGTLIDKKTNIHGQVLGVARSIAESMGYKFANNYIPKTISAANAYGYNCLPVTLSQVNQSNKALINAYRKLWEEIR